MARVSFNLRRNTFGGEVVGVGSFNRGTSDLQTQAGAISVDQDSALRSDNIIIDVPTTPESVFEANALSYNSVILNWTLSENFTAIEDVSGGQTKLIGIAIVYSKTGYPETVKDGVVIYSSSGTDSFYTHQSSYVITTDAGPQTVYEPTSGKWAYYSLFGYYNESGVNGTYYYNKLVSLETLVPNNYGSSEDLWKRIPKYYRESDDSTLYKFVSTFGFELDTTRTLIDAVMTQYDPLLAEAEAVDQLAKMLGLEVSVNDVGVTRTRALLHDIGHLRRKKGTVEAITGYLTAISGGAVDVVVAGAAPYYSFFVHSQRANLVGNPRFVNEGNWTVASENSVTVDSTDPYGISITCGGTATKVAVRSTIDVPVSPTVPYYMSMEITGNYDVVYEPLWHTGASWSSWGSTAAVTQNTLGENRYAYQMKAVSSKNTYYPVFVFKLNAGQTINLDYWMVEPNNFGTYFDGNTIFGGNLYQNQSSDHLWEDGQHVSLSTYTANRQKTQDALTRLLPKILPVTLLGGVSPKYAITYDCVPGQA
jgi:hypothetical protein